MPTNAPHFLVIGAMKCGTSTLHVQLAAQPGIFMTNPKEPCFFSDDPVYARGRESYQSLFDGAAPGDLCGESSTHYTKLPTYPRTVDRIAREGKPLRFVYLMRHPLHRLVSHYVHEWSEGTVREPIDEAVDKYCRLVDYGRYAMQLRPYVHEFGFGRILPIFLERLHVAPQRELERICRFVGYRGKPVWDAELEQQNLSVERMRRSRLRDSLVHAPILRTIRRSIVPKSIRESVKSKWRLATKPELSDQTKKRLERVFDEDLKELGDWLNHPLSCDTFAEVRELDMLDWAQPVRQPAVGAG